MVAWRGGRWLITAEWGFSVRPAAEMDPDSRIHQRLIWKPGRCSSFDSFCLEAVRADRSALNHTPPPPSSILFKQTPFWLSVEQRRHVFGGILLPGCIFLMCQGNVLNLSRVTCFRWMSVSSDGFRTNRLEAQGNAFLWLFQGICKLVNEESGLFYRKIVTSDE